MKPSDFKETSPGVWEVRDSNGNVLVKVKDDFDGNGNYVTVIGRRVHTERYLGDLDEAIQAACDHFNKWVRDNAGLFEGVLSEAWNGGYIGSLKYMSGEKNKEGTFEEFINSLKQDKE